MKHNFPTVRPIAVLEKINALPSSQKQPAVGYWYGEGHRRQCSLDVSGHVIDAFGAVNDPAHGRVIGRRHEATEEDIQIAAHVWIRILLDEQRTRRVTYEHREQSGT